MATNFPTSLDTLTNPTATDTLDSPPHDTQHADANDAIEALEAKVGVDSSAVTTSLDYRVGQLELGGGSMTTSSTAPSSPSDGDMWYDTDDGRTYVYYDDGTSQQWVEFGAPAVAHGKILQVVSTTKTDVFTASMTQGAFTSVTGLSATITPADTSSTILIFVNVSGVRMTSDYAHVAFRVLRGSTEVGSGDAAGTRSTVMSATRFNYSEAGNIVNASGSHLDSPSTTSATTYSVNIGSLQSGTGTVAVNRSADDTDSPSFARTSSTITLMEVAG